MTLSYWNPTKRYLEEGSVNRLREEILAFCGRKILCVLGQRSFRRSLSYEKLKEALKPFALEETPPIPPNPSVDFVEDLRKSLKGKSFDVIVGIGGGSVLDVAKILSMLLSQKGNRPLESYVEGKEKFAEEPLPLIAVPTTSGTGSEVTPYASVETRDRRKISLSHPGLYPKVALIDPLLTHSMPPYLTACTGLDALSQAIESFWSIHHTPFSEPHSLKALALIRDHLERAVKNPTDAQARFAMSHASTEAGLAIAQTRTTAVHSVSYPLTSFFGIPHGHACALTLAAFIRYNEPAMKNGRASLLWETMGLSSAEQAAQFVEKLMEKVGLERSLKRLGIDRNGLETVVQNGFRPDRVKNNPRELTPEALREILEAIY